MKEKVYISDCGSVDQNYDRGVVWGDDKPKAVRLTYSSASFGGFLWKHQSGRLFLFSDQSFFTPLYRLEYGA